MEFLIDFFLLKPMKRPVKREKRLTDRNQSDLTRPRQSLSLRPQSGGLPRRHTAGRPHSRPTLRPSHRAGSSGRYRHSRHRRSSGWGGWGWGYWGLPLLYSTTPWWWGDYPADMPVSVGVEAEPEPAPEEDFAGSTLGSILPISLVAVAAFWLLSRK